MSRSLPLLVVLAALFAPAPAHAAPTLSERVEAIESNLEAWDLPGARRELTALEQTLTDTQPGQTLLLMQAKVAFFSSNYALAVQRYEEAGAESGPNSYRKLAEDALAETRDDKTIRSAHFELGWSPGKDEVLVPWALETLEAAYAALSTDFAFDQPGLIKVELLPDDEALSRLSTLSIEAIRKTGTIAICKFDRLMVISPRALLRGYDWRDTLNHELAHLFISRKSRNTVPIWLHEGMAKYEETRWRGPGGLATSPASEWLLGKALKADKLITFEQMHPSMALLPSQEDAATAFAEVLHAIEFLVGRGGYPLLVRTMGLLEKGATYQEAVGKAYGAPFDRFVSDWKGYLRSRSYPGSEHSLADEKLSFKGKARAKELKPKDEVESTELTDFADISDAEARKWAHLGELLRARKRYVAAVTEFEKARARVGDRSSQLSTKYAKALIATQRLPEARKVLEASLLLSPHAPQMRLELGLLDLLLDDAKAAREQLVRVIDVNPFDPRVHEGLATAATKLGDAELKRRAEEALAILTGKGAAGAQVELHLASRPWARVTVDGKALETTTPTVTSLPPGKHQVVLENPERQLRRELTVELKAGEPASVDVDLDVPADAGATAEDGG